MKPLNEHTKLNGYDFLLFYGHPQKLLWWLQKKVGLKKTKKKTAMDKVTWQVHQLHHRNKKYRVHIKHSHGGSCTVCKDIKRIWCVENVN